MDCLASASLTEVVQMFPTIIKSPHVGNVVIQMDDDDCGSDPCGLPPHPTPAMFG